MLSEKITDERKKLGLSQEELAEKLYVSRQSVSKWESGKSLPEITKIIDLAALFGVSTDYLLIDGEEKNDADHGSTDKENGIRALNTDEINRFLRYKKKASIKIAVGVFLCIFSSMQPFVSYMLYLLGILPYEANNILGTVCIPLCVGIGVALFISIGIKSNEYSYIGDENTTTTGEIRYKACELKNKSRDAMYRKTAFSVFLFIFSAVPLIYAMLSGPGDNKNLYWQMFCLCHCIFITLSALGVSLIVYSSSYDTSANELLMSREEKIRRRAIMDKYYNRVLPAYWIIMAVIYFAVSFITYKWTLTWIMWIFAAFLFIAVKRLIAVQYDMKNKK